MENPEVYEAELNLDNFSVTEEKSDDQQMTDLQIYGINSATVRLLSKLRKYIILIQLQIDLVSKPQSIQPVMREIYQYSETQMIMDIREELDMYRVYASDRIVIKNVMHVREKFEQAISYVTENMQTVESVIDKSYIEILDTFIDSLHQLTDKLTKKSILSDQY